MVPDLRGGAALLVAALQAQTENVLNRADLLVREYENIAGTVHARVLE